MARNYRHLAMERQRPDLLERASDGTAWAQPAIFCAALAGYELLESRDAPEAPLAMAAANA
ncbi:MAG: hypothetical protein H0T69_18615 [Thermoleophilaceae bacterium]|nr:hypothetical protein [Thermoleophilaceae bacterium]